MDQKWRKKLKDSGFVDIENEDGSLKIHDRRTISFENRERILDFHLELTHLLTNKEDIEPKIRMILQCWSDGLTLLQTVKKAKVSRSYVIKIRHKYKTGSLFPQ